MFDQLKNLKSLAGLMGQAGEMKEKMAQLQESLAKARVEADAGAGAVKAVANGKGDIMKVELDPSMIQTLASDESGNADKQMIEDLIAAACNAAIGKSRRLAQEEMSKLTGGLDLSGFEKMLGQ